MIERYSQITVEDVKNFWEKHPLFVGETSFDIGSKEFFEEHKRIVLNDCLTPIESCIPKNLPKDARILDLGCGIGFWTIEFQLKGGYENIYAADLAQTALELTKKRLEIYGLRASLSLQNAEKMTFEDEFFDHVNCQGVIHHTPDTQACIREIARALKKDGTAGISVYYENIFLKLWPLFSMLGRILNRAGFKLKGRGRESIFLARDKDEIARLYDGKNNPIGKYFSKKQIFDMLKPYFKVEDHFFTFFPARALPFRISGSLHRFLSKNMGFLICLNLRKI